MSNDAPRPFREAHPLTWSYHRNTSRWTFNTLVVDKRYSPSPPKEYPRAPYIALPPSQRLAMGLQEAIEGRSSCRRFRPDSISVVNIGTMLQAAYGVLGRSNFGSFEFLDRPVPSAGGLYPLEIYVLARRVEGVRPGVYHYDALRHGLEQVRNVLVPTDLSDYLFMGQGYVTDAPAIFVVAADLDRNLRKYGDRGYRYILFEAGHCAQNVNLAAASLGMGSCNVGGFFDEELAELLSLDTELEVPLYGIAVGMPLPGGKTETREPSGR